MSEEKQDPEVEAKPTEESASEETSAKTTKTKKPKATDATAKAEAAAKAAEKAEIALQKAIEKAAAAKEKAEAAAELEYKAIADEIKEEAAKGPDHTFKRQGEEIFRREMDEPEFWLDKKDRFPRPILSAEEEAAITRKAEVFQDVTPNYAPEHVLSPEYRGVSNYERSVGEFLEVAKLNLETLKVDPDTTEKQIQDAKDEITYLESIYENYYIGMNVFRTARGGRDKIKS
ncbi:MAG: hypothetical protein ACE5DT_06735 [Nitrosopumilus sp.]